MGALTETGNGERDFGGEIMSACLSSTAHPLPASPFLWQPVPVQLILLPARAFEAPKAQKSVGLLQGEPLRAVGKNPAFERELMNFAHSSLGGWGGEHGTGLLAVPLHLPSSASAAAHHPSLPLLPHPMHRSPVASLGFGRMAEASRPDASQERRGTGQILLTAPSYITSLTRPLKFITLFCI